MAKSSAFLLSCLALLMPLAHAAESGLVVSLQAPASRFIMGEPIAFTVVWENQGSASVTLAYRPVLESPVVHLRCKGPVSTQCATERDYFNWKWLAHTVLQPQEKKTGEFTALDLGAVGLGAYEAWLECDTTNLSPDWDQVHLLRVKVESNHVAFQIVPPTGADKEAFGKHANACQQIGLSPSEILSRFPTSTYAGYALRTSAASFGCGTYDCLEKAEETLRRECSGKGMTEEVTRNCMASRREPMQKYAESAGLFLNAHPDFFDAAQIRRRYAYCLAFTGRLSEALAEVRILAQGTGPIADEARAFLESRKGNEETKPAIEAKPGAATKKPPAADPSTPAQAPAEKPPGASR